MPRDKIILACSDCKNRNYFTTKNKRLHPERVEWKKYCPRCNAHKIHKETKQMAMEVATREPSFPARVVNFYQEVVAEMRKVTWPDREQLKDTTIKIIIFVLFIGAVLGAIDLVLQLIFVQGIPSLFSRS